MQNWEGWNAYGPLTKRRNAEKYKTVSGVLKAGGEGFGVVLSSGARLVSQRYRLSELWWLQVSKWLRSSQTLISCETQQTACCHSWAETPRLCRRTGHSMANKGRVATETSSLFKVVAVIVWRPIKSLLIDFSFMSKKPGARLKSNWEGLCLWQRHWLKLNTLHPLSESQSVREWLQLHVRRRWAAAAGDPLRGGFKAWSPL